MEPCITCLMLTRQRVALATRAIDQFIQQDYPHKQLLIVCDGEAGQDALIAYAARRGRSDIRVISVPEGSRSLGALRNLAVRNAEGEYICQWDDDDLYHPTRLSVQLQHLIQTRCAACVLSENLQWITRDSSLYWCNWGNPRGQSLWLPAHPGTLMCRRNAMPGYPEAGPASDLSEDTFVMATLLRDRRAAILAERATLYVYVSHGANTWNSAHHLRLPRVKGLTADELGSRRSVLECGLASYSFGEEVIIRSFDGIPVFRYGFDRKLSVVEANLTGPAPEDVCSE